MFTQTPFKRENHVFRSPQLQDLMLDALRFFNGTPVYELPPATSFTGSGVYALYYTGSAPLYEKVAQLNRVAYNLPIYVGKAIPSGGRRGLSVLDDEEGSLIKRLREHFKSIVLAHQFAGVRSAGLPVLDPSHFACRFMIIPGDEAALIAPIEAALIRNYLPLWNSVVDGFGNHDPGKGRYEQAKSAWDVLHPGRKWADKCLGEPFPADVIVASISSHLQKIKTTS
jgi:hypothetical protein